MDLASRPRGLAILLGLLLATETGISSGRLGLWLVCVFTHDKWQNSVSDKCPLTSKICKVQLRTALQKPLRNQRSSYV